MGLGHEPLEQHELLLLRVQVWVGRPLLVLLQAWGLSGHLLRCMC